MAMFNSYVKLPEGMWKDMWIVKTHNHSLSLDQLWSTFIGPRGPPRTTGGCPGQLVEFVEWLWHYGYDLVEFPNQLINFILVPWVCRVRGLVVTSCNYIWGLPKFEKDWRSDSYLGQLRWRCWFEVLSCCQQSVVNWSPGPNLCHRAPPHFVRLHAAWQT